MKLKTNTLTLKNFIFALTIFALLPFAWSCGDDKYDYEKEKEKKVEIPQGWTINGDLELLSKKSWYLYKSGNDSVKLRTYCYNNEGGVSYYSYRQNKNGSHNYKKFAYINGAYSIEKDDQKQILGIDHYKQFFGAKYEIVDNSTVIMYSLPELDIPAEGYEFKAVTSKTYNDKNRFKGGWYNTGVVDSTVIVFDGEVMKEYLFVRTSPTIVDSWDHGEYYPVYTKSYLGDELFATEYEFRFDKYSSDYYPYTINGDKLTIEWKEPAKTMTYTRIKQ